MCWLEHTDLYRAIGGTETCRKLSAAFYSRVAQDSDSARSFRERHSGVPLNSLRRFWRSCSGSSGRCAEAVVAQPARIAPAVQDRSTRADHWLRNIKQALEEMQIAEPVRGV